MTQAESDLASCEASFARRSTVPLSGGRYLRDVGIYALELVRRTCIYLGVSLLSEVGTITQVGIMQREPIWSSPGARVLASEINKTPLPS